MKIDNDRFEHLSALCNNQTESVLYHLEMANHIMKIYNKTSKELYNLEQKLNRKRGDVINSNNKENND